MAIPFESLAGALTAFDNDLILSIIEDTGDSQYPRAENVPCHLSITQADSPGDTQQHGANLPVKMYGKVYIMQDVVIMPNDVIEVQKRAADGTVLATYSGKCGVPSVRQGRKEAAFEITKVKQPSPEPVAQTFNVDIYADDGAGGHEWVSQSYLGVAYTVTAYDKDGISYVQFGDGWVEKSNKLYYEYDMDGKMSRQVIAGTKFRKTQTTEQCVLQSAPVNDGGLMGWTAQAEWTK